MSRLKLYAHTRLPARAVSWLQSTKRRSYKVDPCIPAAHSRFMLHNELSRPNVIRMREGIQFYTHAEFSSFFSGFAGAHRRWFGNTTNLSQTVSKSLFSWTSVPATELHVDFSLAQPERPSHVEWNHHRQPGKFLSLT